MSNMEEISVVIRSRADTSGFDNTRRSAQTMEHDVNRASEGINLNLGKIGKTLAAAFSIKVIKDFTASCLDLGSNLVEVQNVVDQTFKTLNQEVNKFASEAIESFGMSETTAKKMVGTYGAMAKAFGFSESEALKMSKTIAELNADVSSFYNIGLDAAGTKMKAIFSGETESLKDLGIVMTQSALDQYALANGFGKTTQQMTEQEKVMLRYNFILDQMSDVSGDFARNSNTWANQLKILEERFNAIKASIGQALIAVLTPALNQINAFVAKLVVASEKFKEFTVAIFGAQEAPGGAALAGISQDLAGIQEEAVNAGESIKKTISGLAGFDELNVLQTSTANTGSSGVNLDPLNTELNIEKEITESKAEQSQLLNDMASVMDKIKEKIDRIKEAWSGVFDGLTPFKDIIPQLEDSSNRMKESIGSIFKSLGDAMNEIILDVLPSLVKSIIDNFSGPVSQAIAQAFEINADIYEKIAEGAGELINKIMDKIKDLRDYLISELIPVWASNFDKLVNDTVLPAVKQVTEAIIDVFFVFIDKFIEIGSDIAKAALDACTEVQTAVVDVLNETYTQFIKPAVELIKDVIIDTLEIIGKAWDKYGKSILESLTNTIKNITDAVKNLINDVILPVINKGLENLKEIWENNGKDLVEQVVIFVSNVAELVADVIEVISEIVGYLVDTFGPAVEKALEIAVDTFSLCIGFIVGTIAELLMEINDFITFFKNIFAGDWDAACQGLSESFGRTIERITKGFKSLKEYIKETIENVKELIKSLAGTPISAFSAMFGGESKSKILTEDPNMQELKANAPRLAHGGIITKEQFVTLGDQGKEAVIPLERSDVFDRIGQSVASALFSVKDSGQTTNQQNEIKDINLQIDGQTIAQAMFPYIKKEAQRLGFNY